MNERPSNEDHNQAETLELKMLAKVKALKARLAGKEEQAAKYEAMSEGFDPALLTDTTRRDYEELTQLVEQQAARRAQASRPEAAATEPVAQQEAISPQPKHEIAIEEKTQSSPKVMALLRADDQNNPELPNFDPEDGHLLRPDEKSAYLQNVGGIKIDNFNRDTGNAMTPSEQLIDALRRNRPELLNIPRQSLDGEPLTADEQLDYARQRFGVYRMFNMETGEKQDTEEELADIEGVLGIEK
jgi:hypothetical protein